MSYGLARWKEISDVCVKSRKYVTNNTYSWDYNILYCMCVTVVSIASHIHNRIIIY